VKSLSCDEGLASGVASIRFRNIIDVSSSEYGGIGPLENLMMPTSRGSCMQRGSFLNYPGNSLARQASGVSGA